MALNEDQESVIQIIIMSAITIVGFVLAAFGGKSDLGWGITGTALVSMSTVFVPFMVRRLREARDLRGVIKVVTRAEAIFTYLMPELQGAVQICLLGNALLADVFNHYRFREIVKAKKSTEDFKLRVCIYSPDKNNEFLRKRAKDEVTDQIISLKMLPQDQKDAEEKKLVQSRLGHLIRSIEGTRSYISELKHCLGEKLELRMIDKTYVLDSILIADEKIVVCDYVHQSGRSTPVLVLKGSPAGEQYKREFERIWSLAKTVD